MIDTHELKKRDLYLNKIIAFQDTEPVKVEPEFVDVASPACSN